MQLHTKLRMIFFLNSYAVGKTKLRIHKCFRHWECYINVRSLSPSIKQLQSANSMQPGIMGYERSHKT